MQSNYLCVILHVKRKKLIIVIAFTWFLILEKIEDGGQDGDHVWWRHRPPAVLPPIKYTSSCREHQRLSTECKIVSKHCNISKNSRESLSIRPFTTVGVVWLCLYVRGLRSFLESVTRFVLLGSKTFYTRRKQRLKMIGYDRDAREALWQFNIELDWKFNLSLTPSLACS